MRWWAGASSRPETAEYVHWLNERWGAALFTDVGGAADSPREWQALKSYGVGARYKTPAGPFALDLAYAGATTSSASPSRSPWRS